MKITIEPTKDKKTYSTVSISIECDDLTISDMFERLIIPALLGMEFSQSTIDKYLDN